MKEHEPTDSLTCMCSGCETARIRLINAEVKKANRKLAEDVLRLAAERDAERKEADRLAARNVSLNAELDAARARIAEIDRAREVIIDAAAPLLPFGPGDQKPRIIEVLAGDPQDGTYHRIEWPRLFVLTY